MSIMSVAGYQIIASCALFSKMRRKKTKVWYNFEYLMECNKGDPLTD